MKRISRGDTSGKHKGRKVDECTLNIEGRFLKRERNEHVS